MEFLVKEGRLQNSTAVSGNCPLDYQGEIFSGIHKDTEPF